MSRSKTQNGPEKRIGQIVQEGQCLHLLGTQQASETDEIEDLLDRARKVLTSGSPMSRHALKMNILAHSNIVDQDVQRIEIKGRLELAKQRNEEFKRRLDRLNKRLRRLEGLD